MNNELTAVETVFGNVMEIKEKKEIDEHMDNSYNLCKVVFNSSYKK